MLVAHETLAQLEAMLKEAGGNVFLCTQNVDDLHERAGSRQVVHMHGELLKARCENCKGVSDWREDMSVASECPRCWRTGGLRPHVVWFGEIPFHLDAINDALRESDLFVAIGTSGSVFPAAGLVREARRAGIGTCEINLEPSENAHHFDEAHYGPASEAVPAWVMKVLHADDSTSPKHRAKP